MRVHAHMSVKPMHSGAPPLDEDLNPEKSLQMMKCDVDSAVQFIIFINYIYLFIHVSDKIHKLIKGYAYNKLLF